MPTARPRAAVVALGVAACGLLGACGGGGETGESSEPPPSTVQEGPVAATAVAIGDCLNGIVIGASERAEISSAEVVSCDRPHGLEVYATFTLEPADLGLEDPAEYPGRAPVIRAADAGCTERIAELAEDPTEFGLIALWPSHESWTTGDRTVACAVFSRDGASFDRRQL